MKKLTQQMDLVFLANKMGEKDFAEFIQTPEVQEAAMKFLKRDIEAGRIQAAVNVIKMFQVPDQAFLTEEMNAYGKAQLIATLKRGGLGTTFALADRFKIDAAFLHSAEVLEAATIGRDLLLTKSYRPKELAEEMEKAFGLEHKE